MAACIAHAPGNQQQKQISVSVSASVASPASVPVSTATTPSTIQYTATVTGTGNTAVTWSLAAASNSSTVCTATGDALGTITSTAANSMTYTAPTEVPVSPCGVAVTATSNEDNSTNGQALVNVHVVVVMSPATDTIGQGANLQFSSTVVGAPSGNQGVIWSASCPACGSQQSGGAFDANNPGLFIAPGFTQGTTSVVNTINATSNFDPQQFGTATITVQPTDPLGTISNLQALSSAECPADSNGGLDNANCYSMTVSCDAISDVTAYLKVNTATTPVGTVMFLIGSGANGLYDSFWQFGYKTVETVFNAHYNTVQISFGEPFTTTQPKGWLQGTGGVRRLACRYATVLDWVYNNPHKIDPNSTATTSAPLCATGNSAGASALAYAMIEYGLAGFGGMPAELTMSELTAGPVTSRLDQGCVCNQNQLGNPSPCAPDLGRTTMCYTHSEASIIDPAYQPEGQSQSPTLCSDGLNGTDVINANRFESDSNIYQPNKTIIPPSGVRIHLRFGGMDTTTGIPQSQAWINQFGTAPNQACSANATHEVPDDSDGAMDIANDIIGKNNRDDGLNKGTPGCVPTAR